MKNEKVIKQIENIGFHEDPLYFRGVSPVSPGNLPVFDENEKCYSNGIDELRFFKDRKEWDMYSNIEMNVIGTGSTPRNAILDALDDLRNRYSHERERLLGYLE